MSTKDKLIARFKRQPKDFTFDELVSLLGYFGFTQNNKGKTSGSRVEFESAEDSIIAHKPHPSNRIKGYQMKQIFDYLKEHKYIK
ncbi:hypothetical protein FACS189432_06900 [Bacteroidia bacterium]|nr:hypothetical protein FACS189426_10360 [Bacteroidia bacterium]GHT28660.1 hypothetical protein FACS189432_06900 [Bacteroidia bacterium]GHU69449.1 hypothetical protein FACS189413_08390 [Bacteroidia bacterium]